ncbi:MAG: hypothetical protein QM674_23390 [Burkholderiaceae bacterium]
MVAVIAAPAIVLAGAGVAAAQSATSPGAPDAAASPTAPSDAEPRDRPEAGGPDGHYGFRHASHHRGPMEPMGPMGVRPDANGNVSRADVQAAQQRQLAMFDQIDANHDGVISKDERMAFHRQMRDARPPKAPAPPKG